MTAPSWILAGFDASRLHVQRTNQNCDGISPTCAASVRTSEDRFLPPLQVFEVPDGYGVKVPGMGAPRRDWVSSEELLGALSEIEQKYAPERLFVAGKIGLPLPHPRVAIIGTRTPSPDGLRLASKLSKTLSHHEVIIVSGLARGIDSASHRGALEAPGKTVAVFGSGLDVIYPRENKRLAEQIAGCGAVISEFPMGTAPTPENFPIRNRIISGLALGTIIVEAAEYSGSLITARLALEQNREVFAVPGNITSPQSFGPNHLIKQGAKLVDQWIDVVEEFPSSVRNQLFPESMASQSSPPEARTGLIFEQSLTPDQKAVFDVLRVDEAMFVDSILELVSTPQPRVLAALLELEMSGLVRQLPGKNFIRKL